MISYYLLNVCVSIKSDWNRPLFTGKLVKSLLIDAEPRFKPLFEKSRGLPPKLVHITPLYEDNGGGRVRCVYSSAKVDTLNGRVLGVERVRVDGVYRFYVGFVEIDGGGVKQLKKTERDGVGVGFDLVYNALLNIGGRHVFKGCVFDVELISIQVEDVYKVVHGVIEGLEKGLDKLKIVFASPTLLRDPLRSSKHKSLVPTPMNIFSTPVYIYLYLVGRLKSKTFYRLLVMMHKIFSEPYSLYSTTRIKWVVYGEDKKPIPALTGYVNLHVNRSYYDEYARRYNMEELLENILSTLATLGTGTSRATGFGHISIHL